MYPNPTLDAELAKDRQARQSASHARAQDLKQRHSKSAFWTILLGLFFG